MDRVVKGSSASLDVVFFRRLDTFHLTLKVSHKSMLHGILPYFFLSVRYKAMLSVITSEIFIFHASSLNNELHRYQLLESKT